MTALATGLALVPIVLGGSRAGYEIEHPLAVVILGGLVTSTLLNLFIVPALYLKYGRPAGNDDGRRRVSRCGGRRHAAVRGGEIRHLIRNVPRSC